MIKINNYFENKYKNNNNSNNNYYTKGIIKITLKYIYNNNERTYRQLEFQDLCSLVPIL